MADLSKVLAKELKKTGLEEQYKVEVDNTTGKVTLTAKEGGTDTPRVVNFDAKAKIQGVEENAGGAAATALTSALGVQETKAMDAGIEIDADSITEYDGTNYDDAVFEINGHKFVLMTNTFDTDDSGTVNDEYMRAVNGLGSDVTVLVGGRGGLKSGVANGAADDGTGAGTAGTGGALTSSSDGATDAANNNFQQNIKKIAEVTGLTVTDAWNERTSLGSTDNSIRPGMGIRLSAKGSTKEGGLTLQIGDTAESYNQLKVQVGDMHTKALGIDKLDISTPEGAAAAIQTIRDAINNVSSVRGDLGAVQNRLEHTANNLSVMAENIQDAESTIRDTDIAEEMMSYTKNNILIQSAQAMLAQANAVPQGVLQLLG
ncbi:MAG: hypothetical protein K2O18_12560 [Oscillospiraceae bacterium]|nr:hypothetical protein [Oscillospiraceae bacterium]